MLHESNGMVSKLDHGAEKMKRPFAGLNPMEDTNLFLRALRLRRGMCNGGSHMKSFRLNNMLNITEGTAETPKLKFVDACWDFVLPQRLKMEFLLCFWALEAARRFPGDLLGASLCLSRSAIILLLGLNPLEGRSTGP